MKFSEDVREDWLPIFRETFKVLTEVLDAGEKQRLAKGLDPHAWFTSDPKKRLNHVLLHVLKCHHDASLNVLVVEGVDVVSRNNHPAFTLFYIL